MCYACLNQDDNAKKEAVKEVLSSVEDYCSFVKSGNETLDVVLTEKSMQCKKLGIKLVCMADGTLLKRMNPVDIYSFFGNAVDNAIESLKSLADEDKKLITLNLTRVSNMAKIHIDNYVEVEPKVVDGFPQTTKGDKENHGYGLKSMKRLVEKYGGELRFAVKEHIFTLEGLMPV